MNITDEENIPNNVVQDYGEMMEEDNRIEQHHENIESPPPLPPPISFSDTELQRINESDIIYSSDDDSLYISRCETGHFIRDGKTV